MRECSLRVVGTLPRVSHSGPPQRIAVYIDGFNLYYSLRAKEWRHCYWLNIRHLAIELLLSHQELVKVRYFTSRIAVRAGHPGDEARRQRQSTYLDALQTLDDVEIHYGRHASRERSCPAGEATWEEPEEKMTDVNIAVELLGDAQDGLFDTAMIVSGDTDLVGVVRAVRERYPDQDVLVILPGRHSNALANVASEARHLSEKALVGSQFPDRVVSAGGYVLQRPPNWV